MRTGLKYIVHENHVSHYAGRLKRAARSFSEQNKPLFVFGFWEIYFFQFLGAETFLTRRGGLSCLYAGWY